ncbi:MAG: tryptophanyl-tRNA synthetase, partial [Nocardioidaceae bacterium]|nr:tryptophanyl-tRNA synthetase [Nocardioidaceae bacterium]
TRASLYTYPVLMAADILLYRPSSVPVGDDQRQHVELTRDLAIRFNSTYGRVFTVPEVTLPAAGARVMDLQSPGSKMSKSAVADAGVIRLLDPPDVVRRKVARAVTDSDTGQDAVRAAADKPGVTNLLDILVACGGSASGVTTYGALKSAVTEAVVAVLEPLQKAYDELATDPAYVAAVFAAGSARCRDVTAPVLASASSAMGL